MQTLRKRGEKNKRRGKTPRIIHKTPHTANQRTGTRERKPTTHLITPEEIIELYYKQNGKCALSGIEMTHIKDGSGYHGEKTSYRDRDRL